MIKRICVLALLVLSIAAILAPSVFAHKKSRACLSPCIQKLFKTGTIYDYTGQQLFCVEEVNTDVGVIDVSVIWLTFGGDCTQTQQTCPTPCDAVSSNPGNPDYAMDLRGTGWSCVIYTDPVYGVPTIDYIHVPCEP